MLVFMYEIYHNPVLQSRLYNVREWQFMLKKIASSFSLIMASLEGLAIDQKREQ